MIPELLLLKRYHGKAVTDLESLHFFFIFFFFSYRFLSYVCDLSSFSSNQLSFPEILPNYTNQCEDSQYPIIDFFHHCKLLSFHLAFRPSCLFFLITSFLQTINSLVKKNKPKPRQKHNQTKIPLYLSLFQYFSCQDVRIFICQVTLRIGFQG